MPGREGSAASYRFGFGGMEKDERVDPSGAVYTTPFRMLDTRLGRWWSEDPQLGEAPDPESLRASLPNAYAFAEDNPIRFTDPRGDRIVVQGADGTEVVYEPGNAAQLAGASDPFVADALAALEVLRVSSGPGASAVIETLARNPLPFLVMEGEHNSQQAGEATWNPRSALLVYDRLYRVVGRQSPIVALLHELGHAYHAMSAPRPVTSVFLDWEGHPLGSPWGVITDLAGDPVPLSTEVPAYDDLAELWTIEMVENPAAWYRGEAQRTNHRGIPYRTRCVGCTEAASPWEEQVIQEAIRTHRSALDWEVANLGRMGRALDRPNEP
jgi:RHS repeat-associated protein